MTKLTPPQSTGRSPASPNTRGQPQAIDAGGGDLEVAAVFDRQGDPVHRHHAGKLLAARAQRDLAAPLRPAQQGKGIAFLNPHPQRNTQGQGFTDSVGTDSAIVSLSTRRAVAVVVVLYPLITGRRLG